MPSSPTVIILAQGKPREVDAALGFPRHLVKVCGEPIVHRVVRLFREAGCENFLLAAPDKPLWRHAAHVLRVPIFTKTAGTVVDTLRNLHLESVPEGHTVVAYGDVVYSPAVVAALVAGGAPITFAVRKEPSFYTGREYEEHYGFSFGPEGLKRLREVVGTERGQISPYHQTSNIWDLYHHFLDDGYARVHEVPAEDYTDDVDFLDDVERHLPIMEAAIASAAAPPVVAGVETLSGSVVPLGMAHVDAHARVGRASDGMTLVRVGTAAYRLALSPELAAKHPIVFAACRSGENLAVVCDRGPGEWDVVTYRGGHGDPACDFSVEVWGSGIGPDDPAGLGADGQPLAVSTTVAAAASVDGWARDGHVLGCQVERVGCGTYRLTTDADHAGFTHVQGRASSSRYAVVERVGPREKTIRTFGGPSGKLPMDAGLNILLIDVPTYLK